jgi:hypothetical protein
MHPKATLIPGVAFPFARVERTPRPLPLILTSSRSAPIASFRVSFIPLMQ